MKVKQAQFKQGGGLEWYEYLLTSDYDGSGERVGGSTYLNTPPVAEMTLRLDKPLFNVGDDVPITSPKPDKRIHMVEWFGNPSDIARTLTSRISAFRKQMKESGYEWNQESIEKFLSEEKAWASEGC